MTPYSSNSWFFQTLNFKEVRKYLFLVICLSFISISYVKSQCADLYFLRSEKGFEPSTTVYVLQDGVQITSIEKGSRLHAKVCTEDSYHFSASISADNFALFSNKTLSIESGETYYVKVGIVLGIDEPYLKVMSKSKGEKLFNSNVYNQPLREITIKEDERSVTTTTDNQPNVNVEQNISTNTAPTSISSDSNVSEKIIQSTGNIPSVSEFWEPLCELEFKERSAIHSTPLKLEPKVAVNCNGTILAVPQNRFLVQIDDEGLLLKSTDDGQSWEDITDSIPYLSDIFKNNLGLANARQVGIQNIFAGKGDFFLSMRFGDKVALLKSGNEGKSWDLLPVEYSVAFSNLVVLPSGDIIQDSDVSGNSTYITTPQSERTYSIWDTLSNSWIVIEDSKLVNSTRFSTQDYIYRKGSIESELKEYRRIRNYPNPDGFTFNPNQEYYYEQSIDGGVNWQKIILPDSREFWVKPWMEDRRVRTIKDNIVWVQQSKSNIWAPIFKVSQEDYYSFPGFMTGVNGYGYVIKDSILYKSKSVIFEQGTGCTSQEPEVSSVDFKIKFYAYPPLTRVVKPDGSIHTSKSGHIYIGFFEDNKLKVVKGFGPDGKSYWESSNLTEENHLVRFATKTFEVPVSQSSYISAFNINKHGYFLGINDCVTYADDVADEIGINTPSFTDLVVTPMGFLEHLIRHN